MTQATNLLLTTCIKLPRKLRTVILVFSELEFEPWLAPIGFLPIPNCLNLKSFHRIPKNVE